MIPLLFSRRRTRRIALLWAALVVLALPFGPSLAQTAEPASQPKTDTTAARIESIEEQLRGLKNPNEVFVVVEFASTEEALAAREKLLASGVLDRFPDKDLPKVEKDQGNLDKDIDKMLAEAKNLRRLYLRRANVSDQTMALLSHWPKLEDLILSGTNHQAAPAPPAMRPPRRPSTTT